MIEHEDLQVGTRLICVKANDDSGYNVGEIHTVLDNDTGLVILRYRITFEGVDECVSLDELNGIETRYGYKKLVLESEFTNKELFTLEMTGKMPERYNET